MEQIFKGMSITNYLLIVGQAFMILFLFYKSIGLALIGILVLSPVLCTQKRKEMAEQNRWQKNLEFREGLQGIAAALGAGYSVENAMREAARDLKTVYGSGSVLLPDFEMMLDQLKLNQPVEDVLDEYGRNSQIEDIRIYAELFRTTKRTGGNLIAVTRMASQRIGEKIETKQEIYTVIAGKKMESQIMNLVPLGMIVYFWICSPGFLDCLYHGVAGRLFMTVLLTVYMLAVRCSHRIVNIQV